MVVTLKMDGWVEVWCAVGDFKAGRDGFRCGLVMVTLKLVGTGLGVGW